MANPSGSTRHSRNSTLCQCFGKLRVGRGVGTYFGHAFHLDDKSYRTVVTLLRRLCQLVQVLDAA